MRQGEQRSSNRFLRVALGGMVVVAALAALLDHPGVAEVFGGSLIVFLALQLGRIFTSQLAVEGDPGRQLRLDLLLVLVVVLGLLGVGVMAAAIP